MAMVLLDARRRARPTTRMQAEAGDREEGHGTGTFRLTYASMNVVIITH
jgi:hypothetical protein